MEHVPGFEFVVQCFPIFLQSVSPQRELFGLYGEFSDQFKKMAKDAATLIITGKTSATYGGGIATNSPLDIGVSGADKKLTVTKKWLEADGTQAVENLPESIQIALFRMDLDGNVRICRIYEKERC